MATSSALDPQFKKLMPSTVTIHATGTKNNYGEFSYAGGGTTYNARIEKENRMLRTDEGSSLTSDTTVYIYGEATSLNLDSKLTLPDGTVRVIYAIDTVVDETGNVHHQSIYCGR
jgi:hypothetical protein